MSFEKDLMAVLNKHSQDNACDTPDFILVKFLVGCLSAYQKSVETRDYHKGIVEKIPLASKKMICCMCGEHIIFSTNFCPYCGVAGPQTLPKMFKGEVDE